MSGLTLRLRDQPPQRCDLSALTPDRLAKAHSPVERVEIQTTRQRLCIGDIFAVVPGDADDIRLEGGSERFDYVGRGISGGRITVVGDLGQQVGRAMSGGVISVKGNVGRLAGASMEGGRLEISGDAGPLVGAPLPGEAHGITGGVMRIAGNAGERLGDRMRRGLIVVEGAAGDHPASRMIGGTIVCFGEAGRHPGYLMQRGTLIVGAGAPELTPTFIDTGVHELVAMRLIARWLLDEGIQGASLLGMRLRRLAGDTAVLGKGEIFVPAETV